MANDVIDEDALLKSEYEALYREIQDHGTRIHQVLSFCVAGSTALLSYILTLDPGRHPNLHLVLPFLFLFPFAILAPSLLLVQSCLHSTSRIASYLQQSYEKKRCNRIAWQTSIQKYREMSESEFNKLVEEQQRLAVSPDARVRTGQVFDWKRRPFKWALISVFGSLGSISLASSVVSFVFGFSCPSCSQSPLSSTQTVFVEASYWALIAILVSLLGASLAGLIKGWGWRKFDDSVKFWNACDASFQGAQSKKSPNHLQEITQTEG